MMRRAVIVLLLIAVGACAAAQTSTQTGTQTAGLATRPTLVYLVRHGEAEGNPQALSAAGRQRAQDLLATLKSVRFSHIFASHTERSRQTADVIAQAQREPLPVVQLPQPGSRVDGRAVDESLPTDAAAGPLVAAIRKVPLGSTVLVVGNTTNLFPIINELGVPVCTTVPPRTPAGTPPTTATDASVNCLPCRDGSCYGNWFDRIWMVNLMNASQPRLVQQRYGVRTE
jgi:phosphohistidine phosphatase SixA